MFLGKSRVVLKKTGNVRTEIQGSSQRNLFVCPTESTPKGGEEEGAARSTPMKGNPMKKKKVH
jgi:hypothetical protein